MAHLVKVEDEGMGVATLEPSVRVVNCTRGQTKGNADAALQYHGKHEWADVL